MTIMNDGFYIIDIPLITRKNGKRQEAQSSPNETIYLHGDGCDYFNHCKDCTLPDCRYTKKPTKEEIAKATNGG